MRRLSLEEMKEKQLNILSDVAAFCEENRIQYWLDYGTLIGAIRHKGYIPWDDDIDIGMLRPDYDRFMKLYNRKESPYRAYDAETKKGFMIPFGKALDTDTVLYEPDQSGLKYHINIDIFVYDNIPEDIEEDKKLFAKRDRLRNLEEFRNARIDPKGSVIRKLSLKAKHAVIQLVPKGYFFREIIRNARKNAGPETGWLGLLTGWDWSFIRFERKMVEKTVDVTFEGRTFKAPADYDGWLRNIYGDYMTLPPEEKRVTHHSFVAYTKD